MDLDPGLRTALLSLVEPDRHGDLVSPLWWTTKSTRTLAAEMPHQRLRAWADTVTGLRQEGFQLQVNAKVLQVRCETWLAGPFRKASLTDLVFFVDFETNRLRHNFHRSLSSAAAYRTYRLLLQLDPALIVCLEEAVAIVMEDAGKEAIDEDVQQTLQAHRTAS
ncbi:ISAzo13-like element transposase-related protein [Streptomyces sp. SAI-129]|uniref:ISAzo13-like element transposase-related protein n=1 Tax=Streptomyces sp. SAI-129 TaxID=3377727 RepID=UPI003C7974D1